MEEHISQTIVERLPKIIRNLDDVHRKIYILLRLRKTEDEIADRLSLSTESAKEKISEIRHLLRKEGQSDLIEDPEIISIYLNDSDEHEIQFASADLDIDKKLIIKEFISSLREAVDSLPRHQSQLLKLRYKYQMSAKEILGFCRKLEISIIPYKNVEEIKEQDIFYALNVALKEVLQKIKRKYIDEKPIGIENLKYVFEEIGL